jgi:DNA mismatch endonuclease (patch repair protein)
MIEPTRSAIMRAVRRSHTTPELAVRKMLHALGLRYRLHCRDLPGSPDIVLRKHRTVVFVHGCFWHRHPNCAKASVPKTRVDFWTRKFAQNIKRDARNENRLLESGWRVLTVWECETLDVTTLRDRMLTYFTKLNCGKSANQA